LLLTYLLTYFRPLLPTSWVFVLSSVFVSMFVSVTLTPPRTVPLLDNSHPTTGHSPGCYSENLKKKMTLTHTSHPNRSTSINFVR